MSFNLDTSFLYNHQELSSIFEQSYASDHCGICNQKDAETFWPSPSSRWAHYQCISKIAPAESNLRIAINELFKDDRRRQNILHSHAVGVVMEICKPNNLSEFADINGVEKLKKIFDIIGVAAAKQLAVKMASDDSKKVEPAFDTEFGFIPSFSAKL